ncbi:MAG: hypothetical protein A3E87_07990 [Gammaproteobacteria bacterium RIFCSPHIGHO2_12_FULL_35_23]|nr:MAG: hypothetical protein A3E87_07990 [Gammaproteobacteria bacterium RIFCSPHIGHO2_12_FULL_35_23]
MIKQCRFYFIGILLLIACTSSLASQNLEFDITGLTDDPLKNALKHLQILVKTAGTLTPTLINQLYQAGPQEVQESIKPFGFFKSTITHKQLTHEGNNWVAHYTINPSEPLRITNINIKIAGPGNQNLKINKTLVHLPIAPGQIFNVPDYNKTKNKLLDSAERQGYIKAKISNDKILIDLSAYTCIIDLTLDTGTRYYFGPTFFNPNPLSDKFLQRYVSYQQGEPFSSQKLLNLQTALSDSGYFESVGVEPQIEQTKIYQVPIKVTVTPNKRRRYQFGLGYGTITGPRITTGILWRWVNSSGDKINVNVNWSKVNQNVSAQYIIPAHNPATDQYALNAAIYDLNPQHGHALVRKIGVSYISQIERWQRNLSLSYVWETFKIDSDTGTQEARMVLPNLTYTWLSTDKFFNLKHGARVTFALEGAYKNLASTVSFIQGQAQFKTVQSFWQNNRIVLRGNLGYTIIDDSNKLPLSERFYTGGPMSIRGYNEQGIGPGRYITVGSVEYQRRVIGNWYGAVFYDVGNAFNDFTDYTSNLKRGTGVGIVWLSPIGDVSLYVAKALNKKGQPISVDISLGPEL